MDCFNFNFINEIELIRKNNKIEYIDAVILFCQKNELEIETAAYWIKKDNVLKSKIQEEAEKLNIIKGGARLPI